MLATAGLFVVLASAAGVGDTLVPPVALHRAASLARWFRYPPHDTLAHLQRAWPAPELRRLRETGLTAIRLAIHPELVYDGQGGLRHTFLPALDSALHRLRAADFLVVVDFHNEYGARLETPGPWRDGLPAFWQAFAAHLAARYGPEDVVLELMNEPLFAGRPQDWFVMQDSLVAAVRAVAPEHWLLLSGPSWGSHWGLEHAPPMRDHRSIVGVHFYEPAVFTHQGATWTQQRWLEDARDIPFPWDGSTCRAWVGSAAPTWACDRVSVSGWSEHWGYIRRAGQRLQRPLWIGEFGVHCSAPAADRHRWLAKVLRSSEATPGVIGTSVWAIDECFGLDWPSGDPGAWSALRLRPPGVARTP